MLTVARVCFLCACVVLGSKLKRNRERDREAAHDSSAGGIQPPTIHLHSNFGAFRTANAAGQELLDKFESPLNHTAAISLAKTALRKAKGAPVDATTAGAIAAKVGNVSALVTSAADGVGPLAACVVKGCSKQEMIDIASNTAIGTAVTAINMTNPVLGAVATLASTFFQGILGRLSQNSSMQKLYEAIIEQEGRMIRPAVIKGKVDTVKGELEGIAEELLWVPDLLASVSISQVELSYLLTVQHSLATKSSTAFGDCYNTLNSDDCKNWEEAGTIVIANLFSETHFQVLSSIYELQSADSSFSALVKDRLLHVGGKYKPLLNHSYVTYEAYRMSFVQPSTEVKGNGCDPQSNLSVKRVYKCTDTWINDTTFNSSDCGTDTSATNEAGAQAACNIYIANLATTMQSNMKLWPNLLRFVEVPCDASSPPSNGTVGNCMSSLESGSTCQPTCSTGYQISGATSCYDGVLESAECQATCAVAACPDYYVKRTGVDTAMADLNTCCANACPEGQYAAVWNSSSSTATCLACTTTCPTTKVLDGTCGGGSGPYCRSPKCSETRGSNGTMNKSCVDYTNCQYNSDENNSFEMDGSNATFVAACCTHIESGTACSGLLVAAPAEAEEEEEETEEIDNSSDIAVVEEGGGNDEEAVQPVVEEGGGNDDEAVEEAGDEEEVEAGLASAWEQIEGSERD